MASSSKDKGKQVQTEEAKRSEEFEVILDELQMTYVEAMRLAPKALKKILRQQAPRNSKGVDFFAKQKGKLFTPALPAGTFIIKIKPTRNCPPEDVLSLLYRWSDLYFEAFHAVGVWYRLKDAREKLPPQSQLPYSLKNGIVNLSIDTTYPGIGGFVTQVGQGAFQKLYNTLMMAGELVRKGESAKFRGGPFSLAAVAFSEALRFGEFQEWVVDILAVDGFGEFVPEQHYTHFNSWSDDSLLVFRPNTPIEVESRINILKTRVGVALPVRSPHDRPETSSSEDD